MTKRVALLTCVFALTCAVAAFAQGPETEAPTNWWASAHPVDERGWPDVTREWKNPGEEGPGNLRMPTLAELEVQIERLSQMPQVVEPDPFEARQAMRDLVEQVDDREIVALYREIVKAKFERDRWLAKNEAIRARLKERQDDREKQNQ